MIYNEFVACSNKFLWKDVNVLQNNLNILKNFNKNEKSSLIRNEVKYLKLNKELLFLGLPGILLIFIFAYLPMIGIVIAFKDFNYAKGLWGSDWVGFKNFEFFFTSQDAFRVTRNTLLLNIDFIIIGLISSVAFALMLYELSRRATKVYQTVMFFPYFLSWVVVGYIVFALLNMELGGVNTLLKELGFEPIQWYAKPKYWPVILTLAYLWKNVGYYSIIFYTGLMGLDSSYYEAAAIDGASKLQQIRKITIPLLMPLIIMMVLLQIGRIFYADFGMFYFLPKDSGVLYPVTDVIDTYVFRSLRVVGDLGMASAAGLYQSVVGFILVMVSNKIVKKINEENAIF